MSNRPLLKLYKDDFYQVYRLDYVCSGKSMDMDWSDSGERAVATGGVSAAIYVGLNGAGGSATLPIINSSVPAYFAYGVGNGVASLAADAALSISQKSGVAQTGWGKLGVGLGVAGAVGSYVNGQTFFSGPNVENAIVSAVSYWAGDSIVSKVKATPGRLM